MPDVRLGPDEALLVAARGTGPEHGLTRWVQRDGQWHGKHLATVNQLSSLARHLTLPVVYGTSRMGGGDPRLARTAIPPRLGVPSLAAIRAISR
jgi:6-phosphogluconolactonase